MFPWKAQKEYVGRNCKVDDILEFVTEENFDEGCNENQRNGEAKIL